MIIVPVFSGGTLRQDTLRCIGVWLSRSSNSRGSSSLYLWPLTNPYTPFPPSLYPLLPQTVTIPWKHFGGGEEMDSASLAFVSLQKTIFLHVSNPRYYVGYRYVHSNKRRFLHCISRTIELSPSRIYPKAHQAEQFFLDIVNHISMGCRQPRQECNVIFCLYSY